MRLLFIRHADPDYENDSLTFTGEQEAWMLGECIKDLNPGKIYVSTFGRAQKTAEYCLNKLNVEATYCDWLQEFMHCLDVNGNETLINSYNDYEILEGGTYAGRIPWDMLPEAFNKCPDLLDRYKWRETIYAKSGNVLELYDDKVAHLDALLAENGYVRDGDIYRCQQGNHDTLTFICHLGATNALLSHLFNVSPFVTWNYLCMAPASVTEVVSEEREKGVVSFRALRIGDVSHLSVHNRKPSFSARFCECYEDETRH